MLSFEAPPDYVERSLKTPKALLSGYLCRDLTFEWDYLNAFGGVLEYMAAFLGPSTHGTPQKVFHRVLGWSSSSISGPGMLVKPTCSWIGWKFKERPISFEIPKTYGILIIFGGEETENQ